MNWSIKAILARFNGDRLAAIDYCEAMAHTYPHLKTEYLGYLDAIREEQSNVLREAVHV